MGSKSSEFYLKKEDVFLGCGVCWWLNSPFAAAAAVAAGGVGMGLLA
jgi:hypothetical protein